jgi:hypothetical protein
MIIKIVLAIVRSIIGVSKKNIVQTIREKEMDRKDFLKYSGLVLVSAVGFKSLVTIFTQDSEKSLVDKSQQSSHGFGGGKYGV